MNDLKFFIHYCFSFFTDFYIVPLTKFMLRLRLHSLSVQCLSLTLFVLRVLANHHDAAFALDDLALFANGFHGRFYLHDVNLLL